MRGEVPEVAQDESDVEAEVELVIELRGGASALNLDEVLKKRGA